MLSVNMVLGKSDGFTMGKFLPATCNGILGGFAPIPHHLRQ